MVTANQYIEAHHILFYMEDCITQLLVYREDNPKVHARSFMAEYFKCLQAGNHVLHRDYNFVSATPYNRVCFVRLVHRAFCSLGDSAAAAALPLQELHSLLLLLCADFPWQLVEKAGQAALGNDAVARDAELQFADFLQAFQVQLLYSEFLEKCSLLYESLLSGARANIDVFLPTDQLQGCSSRSSKEAAHADQSAEAAEASSANQQRVASSAYNRQIEAVCQQMRFHVPSAEIIRKALGANKTTTYREFVNGLVRSKELVATLGVAMATACQPDRLPGNTSAK